MNLEEFERAGRANYAAFSEKVADILIAAIKADGGYRLQQVARRAKEVASLRKKLVGRGIELTDSVEAEIKDLAGCRLVFYTNSDVGRLVASGLVEQAFEVVEVKIHHPGRDAQEAAEHYISNHYVVRLGPERIALPEYAAFTGMRCEVQVQTILNHAWAEMAHDTIYKAPELGAFGGKEFEAIKLRLQKVANRYLVPAGYEFQKIAYDFQRLVDGKALLDGNALDAVVNAKDNNVRVQALDTFTENVLPFYDDLPGVYPNVVEQLVEAAILARDTKPVPIETPYGPLRAKTFLDVLKATANVLTRYRYVDLVCTLGALRTLYGLVFENEEEREPLIELGRGIAKHAMQVWRSHGPAAQGVLVDWLRELGGEERRALGPLLISMLGDVLSTEVTGAKDGAAVITIEHGAVVASAALREIRGKAIDLLRQQFDLSETDTQRGQVLVALHAATRLPVGAGYQSTLALLVMENVCEIVAFETRVAPALGLSLRQAAETRVHRLYWIYEKLPAMLLEEPGATDAQAGVKAAALGFRDAMNADADFSAYKVLVGFDCVYPPAWEDADFRYAEAETYRRRELQVLIGTVRPDTADMWLDRLTRYASIESNDLATFPMLGTFLAQLAEVHPAIGLKYVDKLSGALERFLPRLLEGLMASPAKDETLHRIDAWLEEGRYVREVAWFLRFANPFDEQLLCRVLQSAVAHGDAQAVRNAVLAAADQYEKHPGALIEEVLLPAVQYLSAAADVSWVRLPWVSWLDSQIMEALDLEQASVVLDALVACPELEDAPEYIAGSIAKRWPERVIEFLGARLEFRRRDDTPPGYDALPFDTYSLREPLSSVPEAILAGARQWHEADPLHFPFDGARLLASIFGEMQNGFAELVSGLIANGDESDARFVLALLSAFEGKSLVFPLVRGIVGRFDSNGPLIEKAKFVLRESGVVAGEFGFADLYGRRKALLEPWLTDESERIREFARAEILKFDQSIAAEVRAAQASIALRKLEYGEELGEAGPR